MAALKEMIGQLLMVGISGRELTAKELRILHEYPFGGFILFGANCTAPDQIVTLCQSLWRTGKQLPPFIAIDHEGGRVHRLPEPFTPFPSARAVGRTGDPNLAYRIARAMAAELTLAGINLNFAPVLDVDSNPRNALIADRSFARDAREVIRFSRRFIEGLRDGGIIPCGKHFPGHGGAGADSHLELPSVPKTLMELADTELRPFFEACREGIECIMTAHVVYPAIQEELPATLAPNIINGVLRRQWRYDGVVFSDDLEMKAVTDNYTDEDAVRLALDAGVDVLLYGHDLARAVQAFERLTAWGERDQGLRASLTASHQRVQAVKRRYLRNFNGVPPAELAVRLSGLRHQELCRDIQGSL